jgi:outer membrane lipopolysaccharide assembly protein LptE/RlpB
MNGVSMRSGTIKLSAGLALLLLLSSCGYHFSGTGAIVPTGVRNIAIPVFFNETSEPYLDADVTQAVVEEFMTDGRMQVVSLEEAELALRGRIYKYEITPLSYNVFNGQTFVQQYRVHLIVEAWLEDLRSKKVLWRERGIQSTLSSDYAVATGDIRSTRISKDAAVKKACQDIGWTLRSRVLEGF